MSVRDVSEQVGDPAALLGGRSFAELSDAELLVGLDMIGRAKRLLDGVGVAATAAVQRRATLEDGYSLSKMLGHKTAQEVVAECVGLSGTEADTWCAVADATSDQVSLLGEVLPSHCPEVARGVSTGSVVLDAAVLVVRTIDEVRPFLSPAQSVELEATLVDQAPQFTRRDFVALCRRLPERLFPEGVAAREDLQRARSGIRISRTIDGLTRWTVTMHPEAAGFLTAAVDARTAPRRQPRFDDDPLLADLAERDDRTSSQRRLDALVDMARESLANDLGEVAGVPVAMTVTVSLHALLSGNGTAQIGSSSVGGRRDHPVRAGWPERDPRPGQSIQALHDAPAPGDRRPRRWVCLAGVQRSAGLVRGGPSRVVARRRRNRSEQQRAALPVPPPTPRQ